MKSEGRGPESAMICLIVAVIVAFGSGVAAARHSADWNGKRTEDTCVSQVDCDSLAAVRGGKPWLTGGTLAQPVAWAPLCHSVFLKLPCDIPFPHLPSANEGVRGRAPPALAWA